MPIPTTFRAYDPDLYPDRAVGVLLPFNGNGSLVDIRRGYNQVPKEDVKPFTLSYSTEEQAITNMINLLLTRKGERPMQPTFGSLIPDYLFEQNTRSNLQYLRDSIEDDISFWLPYIRLKTVETSADTRNEILESDRDHNVVVKIEFQVTEVGANRTVFIFLSNDFINFEIEQ